jgi:hypothetical protein
MSASSCCKTKYPCSVCSKNVTDNQKGLYCDCCLTWVHLKCTLLSNNDYQILSNDSSNWFCPSCLITLYPFNCIEDEFEFQCNLFNYNNCNKLNANVIKSSQQLQLTSKFKPCSKDIDPDEFLYNHLGNQDSNYYLEDEFNAMISNTSLATNFSLIHINARSLVKNLNQLLLYLESLVHKFTIIAVSETWGNDYNDQLFNIPGFTCVCKNRVGRSGGGVALFIANSVSFTPRHDLNLNANDSFECIFVDVTNAQFGTKTVGAVYRPPDTNLDLFMAGFETCLLKLCNSRTECLIAGDYNIDLLKCDVHPGSDNFLNNLYAHSILPLITRPTRFNSNSSTLIDNILVNKPNDTSVSGILITDISDHLPVFYVSSQKVENPTSKTILTSRQISDNNVENFKMDLLQTDWSSIYLSSNVSTAYDLFIKSYTQSLNKNIPIVTKTIKNIYSCNKPWLTKGIIKSIHQKNSLYRKFLKLKTAESNKKYKVYKNKLTSTIRMAEKMYYRNKFETAKGNINKTWNIIKNLMKADYAKQTVTEIKSDGKIITDNNIISNKFNEYFVKVGPSLANKIPAINGKITDFITGNYLKSMAIQYTDPDEIDKIVSMLSSSSSSGIDGICPYIVKNTISEIKFPLAFIFNLSLSTGQFPDQLKIAKIVPIFKSDDKTNISNYRPIYVLPFISKILEKIMYIRLLDYLKSSDILVPNQFGFREKHSTYMAILKLVDDISEELNNKNYSIGIFIDLSKAFDTIDHKLLINKMQYYGIRGIVLDWFKSYLSNRVQYVNINNSNSSCLSITCGVPQGSILGPLLFILYINDIVNVSKLARYIMFADDTNLFFSHADINMLYKVINDELVLISKWFKLNKLSLNIKKTNYILFCSSNKKIDNKGLDIFIDNTKIEQVTKSKFLGVIITDNLKWNEHIKTISCKISKNIGVIFKIRNNLDKDTLLMLYHSLIQPYLEYCNIVWGVGDSVSLQQLLRKQKKGIRAITFSKWNASTHLLFSKLKLLKLCDINVLQTCCFVYKSLHKLLPSQFADIFVMNSEVHCYNTRCKDNIHITSHRLKVRALSIRMYGAKLWNNLSQHLKDSPSFDIFRSNCKNFILSGKFQG